jgi:[protein-PII] uridylyltransferase
MPELYREAFEVAESREHAEIVERRMGSPVHLEIWRRLPGGGAIVCVVADDRPGLLALVRASLVANELVVLMAKGGTRAAPSGAGEAIHFFWIEHASPSSRPVLRSDIALVMELLVALVQGELAVEDVLRRARSVVSARGGRRRVSLEGSAA